LNQVTHQLGKLLVQPNGVMNHLNLINTAGIHQSQHMNTVLIGQQLQMIMIQLLKFLNFQVTGIVTHLTHQLTIGTGKQLQMITIQLLKFLKFQVKITIGIGKHLTLVALYKTIQTGVLQVMSNTLQNSIHGEQPPHIELSNSDFIKNEVNHVR